MNAEKFQQEFSERRHVAEEAIKVLRDELERSTATSGVINQKIEQILAKFSTEGEALIRQHFAEMFDIETEASDDSSNS